LSASTEPNILREYPPVPLIGVGAVIIQNGLVLLVRRAKPPAQGEWSIPGGLVHVGETLIEAAAREALEETGYAVEPIILVELLERIFPDEDGKIQYHYVLADYYCKIIGGSLGAGSDASEAQWVDVDEMPGLGVAEITMRVIRKAMSEIGEIIINHKD
jgi:8-oxo-dGTP diphosphatase